MVMEAIAGAGQAYFLRVGEVAQNDVREAFDLLAPGEGGANKGALTTRLQHIATVMKFLHTAWPAPPPPASGRLQAVMSTRPRSYAGKWTPPLRHLQRS